MKDCWTEPEIDRLNDEIESFRIERGCERDHYGYSGRVSNFHSRSKTLLDILGQARLQSALKELMLDEPVLLDTHIFNVGSETPLHSDLGYFFSQPAGAALSLWIAFEDVHPDAGPLFLIPASHRWPLVRGDDVHAAVPDWRPRFEAAEQAQRNDEQRELIVEARRISAELTTRMIQEQGVPPVSVLLRKGDVMIWDSGLIHGGMKRQNRALSRKSMTAHYIGLHSTLWSVGDFYKLRNTEFSNRNARSLRVLQHHGSHVTADKEPVIRSPHDY